MAFLSKGVFHVMGLIGSWRLVHCLVLTFAIYMTFMSAMLYINGLVLAIYYKLIGGFVSSLITILSFCLCSGIRERWFRAVGVGAVQPSDARSESSLSSDDYGPDHPYKLYPDLSYDIYHIHQNNIVRNTPAPSAPPLSPYSRSEFSKI